MAANMVLEPHHKPFSSTRTLERFTNPQPIYSPTLLDDDTLATPILAYPDNSGSWDFSDARFFSRSPSLTHSAITEYSPIQDLLPSFDSNPGTGVADPLFNPIQRSGSTLDNNPPAFFPNLNSGNMQSDWTTPNQSLLTPRSATRYHQRETSISSIGSNGPASPCPFPNNTSTPYIASAESAADSLHDFENNNFQLAKSYGQPNSHNMVYAHYAYPRSSAAPVPKLHRGLHIPAQLIGSGTGSVASSVAPDSPATPADDPEDARRRQNADSDVPKLERSVSDLLNDNLVSNKVTITSSEPSRVFSPSNTLFDQTIASYNHQTSAPAMATASQARSPFQNSSPLAQVPHNFSSFGSAPHMRTQHQMAGANASTPQTISPKETLQGGFNPFSGNSDNFPPLFAQSDMYFGDAAMSKSVPPQNMVSMEGLPLNNYLPAFAPGLQVPQSQSSTFHTMAHSGVPSLSSLAPSRLGSAETGMGFSPSNSPTRPASVSANSGTYTCTYRSCTKRFETPAQLQKHKKDGHRNGTRRAESVAPGQSAAALMDTQNGPHRCERENPSTGNPCNKDFSRPYDLTRHEASVHDPKKRKVHCALCTEEKTFSRGDALTRHYRVVHPEVEPPGRQRRRRGPEA